MTCDDRQCLVHVNHLKLAVYAANSLGEHHRASPEILRNVVIGKEEGQRFE
jgi:hypothetical protein